jgi:hypothetical protein
VTRGRFEIRRQSVGKGGAGDTRLGGLTDKRASYGRTDVATASPVTNTINKSNIVE